MFAPDVVSVLRAAVADLAWLQSRGYADTSALKIVGDRYRLDARQRSAVQRASCSDESRDLRASKRTELGSVAGRTLMIDGYNVLTTLEVAMGGGVVLRCRDGSHRDIAGVHGTWRRTEETPAALEAVGRTLAEARIARCRFLLDAPVSNSGRLAGMVREVAERNAWSWDVELVPNPDPVLSACRDVVATADSVILDACASWVDLVGEVIHRHIPGAWVVDLGA